MNRSERRAQWRQENRGRFSTDCWGGPPWPPVSPTSTRGRPQRAAPTNTPIGSVSLHIDELVLHGFPLQTRHAVSEAMQLELTRLIRSSGMPEFVRNQTASGAIDGGSFNVTRTTKPNVTGSLIANAVYGGQWR